ncbi:olfactory receptor 1-like [Discoglossus pictus]
MENQTMFEVFHILAFSIKVQKQPLIFILFFFIYLIGVLGNLIIFTVITLDTRLHSPMYIFLCNLSIVDICFTTVTLPKLLDLLLTGNDLISIIQCFTQMYFFMFMFGTEVMLLSAMAYDRYVAICNPLQYHRIMNKDKCIYLLVGSWTTACVDSMLFTVFASKYSYCDFNTIQNFYCNVKALAKILCTDTVFLFVLYVETLLFGLFPFLLSLISYIKIIITILSMKSKNRRKSFSTCTSHLTVLILFYGTVLCMYMIPMSEYSDELDTVFAVLYSAVTPMLNPLIYSLRNKDVKSALKRILNK